MQVLWAAKDVEFTANYQLSHPWDIPARFNVSGGGVFFWLSNLSRSPPHSELYRSVQFSI